MIVHTCCGSPPSCQLLNTEPYSSLCLEWEKRWKRGVHRRFLPGNRLISVHFHANRAFCLFPLACRSLAPTVLVGLKWLWEIELLSGPSNTSIIVWLIATSVVNWDSEKPAEVSIAQPVWGRSSTRPFMGLNCSFCLDAGWIHQWLVFFCH